MVFVMWPIPWGHCSTNDCSGFVTDMDNDTRKTPRTRFPRRFPCPSWKNGKNVGLSVAATTAPFVDDSSHRRDRERRNSGVPPDCRSCIIHEASTTPAARGAVYTAQHHDDDIQCVHGVRDACTVHAERGTM